MNDSNRIEQLSSFGQVQHRNCFQSGLESMEPLKNQNVFSLEAGFTQLRTRLTRCASSACKLQEPDPTDLARRGGAGRHRLGARRVPRRHMAALLLLRLEGRQMDGKGNSREVFLNPMCSYVRMLVCLHDSRTHALTHTRTHALSLSLSLSLSLTHTHTHTHLYFDTDRC